MIINSTSTKVIKEVAVWSLIVLFLTQATKIFHFWEETSSAYELDAGGQGDIVVISVGLIALFFSLLLIKINFNAFIYSAKKNIIFFIVLCFFLISFLWSEVPFITIKRTFKIAIMVIGVFSLSLEKDLYIAFFKRLILTVLISSFILIFTPYGWMEANGKIVACGVMTHKSNIAGFCAISILFSMIFRNTKFVWFLIISLATIILLLTQGKNPLFNLILASSYLFFMVKIKNKVTALLILLSCVTLCIILNSYFCISTDYLLTLIGKDPTFTGRTGIWWALIDIGIKRNLLLGTGLDSFFIGDRSAWLLKFLDWEAPEAHCGYLKIFLEGGVIGLSIFIMYLILLLHSIYSLSNRKWKYYLSAIVLYSMFYNIVSNSFFTFRLDFLILVFVTGLHPLLDRTERTDSF